MTIVSRYFAQEAFLVHFSSQRSIDASDLKNLFDALFISSQVSSVDDLGCPFAELVGNPDRELKITLSKPVH